MIYRDSINYFNHLICYFSYLLVNLSEIFLIKFCLSLIICCLRKYLIRNDHQISRLFSDMPHTL